MATSPQDHPTYQCPAYVEMAPGWQRVRAVRHLNKTLAENPDDILPKFESEDRIDYVARAKMTDAFEAVDETLHALVGLATRHPPTLEDDVPERIRLDWEDIDGQGTHGDVFCQQVLEYALQDGHCGVLTDYPPAEKGLTLAQEQARGYRAYAVIFPADTITAWRVGRVAGRVVLTMVKLREGKEVPVGAFGTATVERYRTLYQNVAKSDTEADGVRQGQPYVSFVVHEQVPGKAEEWQEVDRGILRGPEFITLRIAYGGERTGILQSRPPLRGLAYTSIAHTQVGSEHRILMHNCAIPLRVFIGRDTSGDAANSVKLTNGIDVSMGGDVKIVEPSGAAFETMERYRASLQRQMGSQGFSMLRRDAPGNMTATENLLQSSKESSKLSKALQSEHDCMEGVLEDFAAFYGLPTGGTITMTKQFMDLDLTAEQIRVLSDMHDRGQLTLETLLGVVQKNGRILEGVEVPKEVAALRLAEANASDPIDPVDPETGEPTRSAA